MIVLEKCEIGGWVLEEDEVFKKMVFPFRFFEQ
jgi:hypothetical protein